MRSEKFEKAIVIVLRHEGGYVNDRADPGGETKFGITKRTYPRLDIKNLTVEQAKDIYYNDWWMKNNYEALQDYQVACKMFDTAVNVGHSQAVKFLQRACNASGKNIDVDGDMGPQTIETANSIVPSVLISAFRKQQAAFYQNLVARRPSLNKFLKGWLNRTYASC